MAAQKSPKKPKVNVQLEWRKHLKDCPDFGYAIHEDGQVVLYRWASPWWEVLENDGVDGLQPYVDAWMSKNYPENYSKNLVKACVDLTQGIIINEKKPLKRPDFVAVALDDQFVRLVYDLMDQPYIKVYKVDKRTGRLMYNDARYVDGAESNVKQYLTTFRIRGLKLDPKKYEGGCYEPAPLQPGSKFYDMLHLAFDKRDIPDFQEFYGDLLSDKPRKAVPFLVGDPDSGKSRWLGLFHMLFGTRVCAAAKLSRMDSNFSLENWIGKRVVLVDEIPTVISEDVEDLLKTCIGGSFINIRQKFIGKELNVEPRWKFLWAANRIPQWKEKSSAFNTRLRVFVVNTCPPEKRIEGVDRIVADTEKGILFDWLLEGLLRIESRGRALRPEELSEKSQVYSRTSARDANPAIAWVEDDEVSVDPYTLTPKEELLRLFKEWAERNGHRGFAGVSSSVFFRDLFFRALEYHGQDTSEIKRDGSKATLNGLRMYCLPVKVSNVKNVMHKTQNPVIHNIVELARQESKGGFKPEEIKVSNDSPF